MHTVTYLKKIPNLKGKTYIITGANSGLGFALAALLLEKKAHVITANRSKERSLKAKEKLLEMFPNGQISEYYFDQANEESIIAFVNTLKQEKVHFDGIVFNAGIYIPGRGLKTSNNMGRTFGVNYYGNYLLTKLLVENDLISEETRLVYTTSPAAKKRELIKHFDKVMTGERISRHKQYKASKAALNIFTLGLMTKSEVVPFTVKGKVSLYHPGVSNTNITRFKFKPLNLAVHIFMRVVFHTPKKAVLGALFALTTDENLKGKILVPRGPFETSGVPKTKKIDERLARHLEDLITETNKFSQD